MILLSRAAVAAFVSRGITGLRIRALNVSSKSGGGPGCKLQTMAPGTKLLSGFSRFCRGGRGRQVGDGRSLRRHISGGKCAQDGRALGGTRQCSIQLAQVPADGQHNDDGKRDIETPGALLLRSEEHTSEL